MPHFSADFPSPIVFFSSLFFPVGWATKNLHHDYIHRERKREKKKVTLLMHDLEQARRFTKGLSSEGLFTRSMVLANKSGRLMGNHDSCQFWYVTNEWSPFTKRSFRFEPRQSILKAMSWELLPMNTLKIFSITLITNVAQQTEKR